MLEHKQSVNDNISLGGKVEKGVNISNQISCLRLQTVIRGSGKISFLKYRVKTSFFSLS